MNRMSFPHLKDIELAAAIAAAMRRDTRIPPDVLVDVSHGVVTLEGEVHTAAQQRAASKLVRAFAPYARIVDAMKVRRSA